MSKELADVLDADPLALAPDKDEYELKYLAPMERIAREEEELKEEKKELKKQLTKLWGLHPAAQPLADKLGKLSPDDRIKVLQGAALILRHNGETLPEDLFHADRLVPGRGIEEGADSPVDDGAKAGKATARKPRSKRDEPDAGANGEIRAAESALPLEDALRAFEENQHKAPSFPTEEEVEEKNRAIAAQRQDDDEAFDAPGEPEAESGEAAVADAQPAVAEVKRRGRKPGSKNKPKVEASSDPVKEAADRAEERRVEQEKLKQRVAETEVAVEAKLNEPPPVANEIDDLDEDDIPQFVKGKVRPIGRALVEF